jgi:hypothetical protein
VVVGIEQVGIDMLGRRGVRVAHELRKLPHQHKLALAVAERMLTGDGVEAFGENLPALAGDHVVGVAGCGQFVVDLSDDGLDVPGRRAVAPMS